VTYGASASLDSRPAVITPLLKLKTETGRQIAYSKKKNADVRPRVRAKPEWPVETLPV